MRPRCRPRLGWSSTPTTLYGVGQQGMHLGCSTGTVQYVVQLLASWSMAIHIVVSWESLVSPSTPSWRPTWREREEVAQSTVLGKAWGPGLLHGLWWDQGSFWQSLSGGLEEIGAWAWLTSRSSTAPRLTTKQVALPALPNLVPSRGRHQESHWGE